MLRALLIDEDDCHAVELASRLRPRSLAVERVADASQCARTLRQFASRYELVILNVSDPSQQWLKIVERLHEACQQSGASPAPLFLCVSKVKRETQFELALERRGARYVLER